MGEFMTHTVGQQLERVAAAFPDKEAIKYTDRPYRRTWKEFNDECDRVAKGFLAHGVKKGDKIAIWATNIPEWLLTLFAACKIGAVLVTVNTAYKIFELEYLLKQSDTKILVMMDAYKGTSYVEIVQELCRGLGKKWEHLNPMLPFLDEIVYAGAGDCPDGMTPWDQLEKDERFRWVRTACWACPWNHCHSLEILEGKYKGMTGDEPEYEGMSAMSALIGNFDDTAGGLALSITIDRLGMDLKEGGFLLAMVYELYEEGILTKEELGGIEMDWGSCDAGIALLHKVARREGIGDILAGGVKRAAEAIGRGAPDRGVYTKQGFAPHIHDQRAQWSRLPGFGMSDYGSNLMNPVEGFVDKENFGIEKPAKAFDLEEITDHYVRIACHRPVDDSTGVCMFYTQADWRCVVDTLNAVTGWDMTVEEAKRFGYRMVSLMRCLNLRNGLRAHDYGVSKRMMSPPKAGQWSPPIADEATVQEMFRRIGAGLGWKPETARPTGETLRGLDLADVAEEMEGLDLAKVDQAVRKA